MFQGVITAWLVTLVGIGFSGGWAEAAEPEIVIIGSVEGGIDYWKRAGFWGEVDRAKDLDVPRVLVVAINPSWKKEAEGVTVALKKELFYRGLLPLILFANEIILGDRKRLEYLAAQLRSGKDLSDGDRTWLDNLAGRYRVKRANGADGLIDELLVRVDAIPPALALGQAAYESAYGTSRFTLQGYALFGQWTYSGAGIKPRQQRASKGKYKVAAFDWPVDSVHAYMANLNTHRAYSGLRRLRADLRKRGQAPSGMELAGTLLKYSETGEYYVRTLRSIIRVNGLDVADKARLRDEPAVLLINVDSEEEIAEMRREIAQLRATGELAELIESMRLTPSVNLVRP